MDSKKCSTSVDLFKFFASIMVVALHTRPLISNLDADYWLCCFCRIGVPFFFVVGSYFYFKSNKPIWGYIKRLLILYLVWFVIEIPFIYERFFDGVTIYKGLLTFTKGLLLHNTFYASWYITATWQATLIVYCLSKRSNNLLYIVGVICAFISVSNAMYANVSDNNVWRMFTKITSFCFASNSFIAAIPYCIIGRYIAQNEDSLLKRKRRNNILLIIFIIIGIIEIVIGKQYFSITDSFWSLYPISFLIVIILISYSISITSNFSKLLRKMSILVYLTHGVVIRLLEGISNINQGIYLFIITVIISITISYIIVLLAKKITCLNYLY